MRRAKRHKVKEERPETSTAHTREKEEHDLAYYIHDRVELMHQVFSVLKSKELRAMAPECVRHISADDLQELCTEELLGISSKRLCAILDGAEPPSDTESSSQSPSPENLETISLDSISSDEEILSQASSKRSKKHKHHRRGSKDKRSKTKRKSKDQAEEPAEKSRASRAGLTVLELLELQARARAIRAQLQQEQQNKAVEVPAKDLSHHSSDGEVEIKEEPAEVVEISSDEDKPKIRDLQLENTNPATSELPNAGPSTMTRRINDLVITVPQSKPTRKIKLNRSKQPVPTPSVETPNTDKEPTKTVTEKDKPGKSEAKERTKKKKKKRKIDKDGSDHDEITLQLSDSEKMDLLEDWERKSVGCSVDSDSSSDSESDSEDSERGDAVSKKNVTVEESGKDDVKSVASSQKETRSVDSSLQQENASDAEAVNNSMTQSDQVVTENKSEDKSDTKEVNTETDTIIKHDSIPVVTATELCVEEKLVSDEINKESTKISHNHGNDENVLTPANSECAAVEESNKLTENTNSNNDARATSNDDKKSTDVEENPSTTILVSINVSENDSQREISVINVPEKDTDATVTKDISDSNLTEATSKGSDSQKEPMESEKDLSEGELTERESSEIEAVELKPEVVCISDDENPKTHKKKKKKDKKSKKEKKSKKKSDFREGADQNFYEVSAKQTNGGEIAEEELNKESDTTDNKPELSIAMDNNDRPVTIELDTDADDVYEILELSDDSSCYEVEGTVLSKEPTAEEIEALSAKIDEIDDVERAAVITDQEIREYDRREKEKMEKKKLEELENVSWKDRYLDSKKVKRVLSTANILNALRKKNRELKKKLEQAKKDIVIEKEVETEIVREEQDTNVQEGSIEHYNTLHGSNKYVDPVAESTQNETGDDEPEGDKRVTREMKKDAKQLLKMYKRLLKYNDMSKEKDPNKKRKKKKKDKKKSEAGGNKEIA